MKNEDKWIMYVKKDISIKHNRKNINSSTFDLSGLIHNRCIKHDSPMIYPSLAKCKPNQQCQNNRADL